MKRELDYSDVWNIAFTDKNGWFNKNYFDYYIRKNKEYKECGIVVSNDRLQIGLPINYEGTKFYITSYDYENTTLKKFRVDSWQKIISKILNGR